MIDNFKKWDEGLFIFLNSFHWDWLDPIMYHISQTVTWIPFYAVLVYFIYKADPKTSWWVFGGVALAILISDQTTSGFMKPFFERLRPCHDERWQGIMHHYGNCGGLYGFASSHAANTFATATFLNLKVGKNIKHLKWLFLWAVIISYTRLYLGVHYPVDIFIGAFIGFLAGVISWFLIVFIKREILKSLLK